MYPKLKPTIDNKYILLEDFKCGDFVVPKGYLTNGANIPRVFWAVVPPFKPKFMNAVLVHDYLCDLDRYIEADRCFEELLYRVEKNFITKTMVFAVKLYHKIKYRRFYE